MEKGYIQIYTGDGKGKTTAALGQAFRAAGAGLNIIMVQFLKGRKTGELESVKRLSENLRIIRIGETDKFFNEMSLEEIEQLKEKIAEGIKKVIEILEKKQTDILILDEIFGAITNQLISRAVLHNILDQKPETMEIILTGRAAASEFIERADLVTEMKEIKHYYQKGVKVRKGIEW